MKIIEIAALDNGAHRNQQGSFQTIPDGWAVIPDGMETRDFPFGSITVEDVNGVMTVTNWTPGTLPEPEPTDPEPTETEQLRADVDFLAAMAGVSL